MKNKITRSIIVLVLICVTAVTLMSFCACQKDDDTQPSGDQPQKEIPRYDSLSARVGRIYINEIIENWDYKNEIEIVNSLSDLERFNILGTSYSEKYFENYVILLIMFDYRSTDKSIEFVNLALKDGKFYPIFATNSPIADELMTDDINWSLYVVGVDKRVLDYEFADILVINRRDLRCGSGYHKSITTVFE